MRTSHHAEEEIRLLFNKVFELVGNRYPSIYGVADSYHAILSVEKRHLKHTSIFRHSLFYLI
jgi:hypothetical protein